jgi:hypothetical protein
MINPSSSAKVAPAGIGAVDGTSDGAALADPLGFDEGSTCDWQALSRSTAQSSIDLIHSLARC